MDLLPKTHRDFNQTEYWNTFFKKRGTKSFEWYGEYLDLIVQIHKYVKQQDKILMVGCGNSKLSMDMYDAGFMDITNIDISSVAIKKMTAMNAKLRGDMKFIQMDATEMTFEDNSFSVILDKGTLDALMPDDSEENQTTVRKYFDEIVRTMKTGGRYICISLLQDHILKIISEYFPGKSCMLRIVRCFESQRDSSTPDSDTLSLPVFAVIATKFTALPQPILEISLAGAKIQRLSKAEEMIEAIAATQKAAMVCNGLSRCSIAGHDEVKIELFRPGETSPRYTLYVVDKPFERNVGKYAAFIVPQGREVEYLFGTPEGRKKLLENVHHDRLAIVAMHRDQKYESWEAVQAELNESIQCLAPRGMTEVIPCLSIDNDVGKRETLVSGFSNISGEFRIEEIEGYHGKIFRRLVFLSNENVIQSEALVKIIKRKNKKELKKIDVGYLACPHHAYMSIGVQLASVSNEDGMKRVLVVGLGGGGLCTFLRAAIKNVLVTAVEIDPIMLEIAEQYFELKQDKELHVVIDDGLKFISRCREEDIKFDVVLFDVDSKDVSLGMSCPPKNFLVTEILEDVRYIIGSKGLFILNLVCRDDQLRGETMNDLKQAFFSVCSFKVEEYINEVVYCTNDNKYKGIKDWKRALGHSGRVLNSSTKQSKLCEEDVLDVAELLKEIKL